jgi:integrase
MDKALFGTRATQLVAKYEATGGKDHSFPQRARFWIAFIGDKPWLDITPEDIERGLSQYINTGKQKVLRNGDKRMVVATGAPHSGATINKLIMAFATLCKLAKKEYGIVPKTYISPTKYVEKQKNGPGRTLDITKEEIERLVLTAGLARWRLLAAFIAVAASSGLRLGNMRALTWSNINLERGTITVQTSKNGEPYTCAISSLAVSELRKIKKAFHKPSDIVFGNRYFKKSFDSAVADAGLSDKITCVHHLRHACASMLCASGANETLVMKQMNQKTSAMVRRYSHLNATHLIDAVGRAWG